MVAGGNVVTSPSSSSASHTLPVPEEALEALADVHDDNPDFGGEQAVRGIAAPVVAAELRRLANEAWVDAGSLLDRAAELDGDTS